jgi:hypothetical protein
MNDRAKMMAFFEKNIELTDGSVISEHELNARALQHYMGEARALRETVGSMKADVYDLADKWVVK